MFPSWLRQLRSGFSGRASGRGKRAKARAGRGLPQKGRYQPRVEALEERTAPAVTILNGGGSGYAGLGGDNPPDTCGAAGPGEYIEVINGQIEIFKNKASGTPTLPGSLDTFLYTTGKLTMQPGRDGTDSTVLYDDLLGRFIIGDLDADVINQAGDGHHNTSNFNFGISMSNNPTTLSAKEWNFYQINTTEGTAGSTSWGDYPGNPGYNKDAVVLTFNMFGGAPNQGSQIVSIDANDLANNVAQANLHVYHNDLTGQYSLRPTSMHDAAAGDPMWLIQDAGDGTHVNVRRMTNVLSNSATIGAATSLPLPLAKQYAANGIESPLNPDSTTMNDIDMRILKAGEFNSTIVATQKVAVSPASVVSATVQIKMGVPQGGSGYAVNDILTVNGGTFTTQAKLKVASIGAGGSVATVTVNTPGTYSSLFGINGTVSGGGGSGATFNIFFKGELDVQWYAIDVSGATPVFQLVGGNPNIGRFGFGQNTYCFDPAIDINASGQIGFGFMESDTTGGAISATTGGFVSTFVTARNATDTAGTMQPLVLVPAGKGTGNIGTGGHRIGDFSGMNTDPANGTFWHVNEFGDGADGTTAIANFGILRAVSPTITVDNNSWGYRDYGSGWSTISGGFNGSERTHAGLGTGSNFAQWQYGANLTAGTPYEIFATWVVDPSNATNAPYKIFDGATLLTLTPVTVNQQSSPGDALFGSTLLKSLFVYTPSTTGFHVIRVQLTDNANGTVVADAVFDPPLSAGSYTPPAEGSPEAPPLAGPASASQARAALGEGQLWEPLVAALLSGVRWPAAVPTAPALPGLYDGSVDLIFASTSGPRLAPPSPSASKRPDVAGTDQLGDDPFDRDSSCF